MDDDLDDEAIAAWLAEYGLDMEKCVSEIMEHEDTQPFGMMAANDRW